MVEIKINLGTTVLTTDLIAFEMFCRDTAVEIAWFTSDESKSDFFKIQRRTDGKNWTTIADVAATNTPNEQEYIYRDRAYHNGQNYYRLQELGLDGTLSDFGIKSISCLAPLTFDIFPNPFFGTSNVAIYSDSFDPIVYQISDCLGRKLIEEKVNAGPPQTVIQLNEVHLEAGTYLLSVQQGSLTKTGRFVVLGER